MTRKLFNIMRLLGKSRPKLTHFEIASSAYFLRRVNFLLSEVVKFVFKEWSSILQTMILSILHSD